MRNLVAGGAGFIGSNLCSSLLDRGEEVHCLDDLSSGQPANVDWLKDQAGYRFFQRDVSAPIELTYDRIYNLACPASPPFYQNDPVQTMKTNVLGALNLLEEAKRSGARILQASTSEVYGDPATHPQVESYWGNVNPIGVRACYDEGKRAAETLFFDFHRQYGTSIRVVRIFNTYGPRMRPDDGRVVSTLALQALKGERLSVFGSGAQTRSFCYVDDMVQGIIAAMDAPDGVTGPINLGNPYEITVLELVKALENVIGRELKIEFLELPSDDPKRRRPDISRASHLLGWKPTTGLSEGLSKLIAYLGSLDS